MNPKFDSKTEENAHPVFTSLGCVHVGDEYFDTTFTDKTGNTFRARPDYYHPASDCYIEFKSATLNSRTSKDNSEKALARAKSSNAFRRNTSDHWDSLNNGWNHSRHKQRIVQKALSPDNFIVVFKDGISTEDMAQYQRLGLVTIPLNALPSWLGFQRLRKAGCNLFKFQLSNPSEDFAYQYG